ncbi:hypothetical protein HPB50_023971 [Hyalomma asiaticum]|uniref:Uncharacterized protein n=1 Tax=Hyalomma asiaticum TaxID=266040 RepID=A0ACB7S504_HYAAI|nr:hypothetical protein HPB50_023971 [Hyalomma asiaticum]
MVANARHHKPLVSAGIHPLPALSRSLCAKILLSRLIIPPTPATSTFHAYHKKTCPRSLKESFLRQIEKLQMAGYPEMEILTTCHKLIKWGIVRKCECAFIYTCERGNGRVGRREERERTAREGAAKHCTYPLLHSLHTRGSSVELPRCERPHTPERAPPLHSLSATPPAPPAPVARGEEKRTRPQLLLWERE